MTRIHVLQTGSTLVSPAMPDRGSRKTGLAFTGLFQKRSDRISVPVKCFLVESGGRKILVDTGWGKNCVRHPLAAVGFGMWFASEPVLSAGETLERWLSRLGIRSGELDAVILTHLDVDHVSGLRDVADAKHIYASAEELAQANSGDLRYNRRLWRGIDIQALPMIAGGSVSALSCRTVSSIAGSVVVISAESPTRRASRSFTACSTASGGTSRPRSISSYP